MKSKITAALLALFLGGLGLHAFYLNRTGKGILYCAMNIIGWLTSFTGIGFFILAVLGIMCIFDFFILVTKDDKKFNEEFNTTN